MGHGDAINSILIVLEDNLERELSHAGRAVPSVDANKPLGIRLDVRECDVYGNAELTSGGRTAFCIPVRGCFQLGRRFGMKTNPHLQYRAW